MKKMLGGRRRSQGPNESYCEKDSNLTNMRSRNLTEDLAEILNNCSKCQIFKQFLKQVISSGDKKPRWALIENRGATVIFLMGGRTFM